MHEVGGRGPTPVEDSTLAGLIAEATRAVGDGDALRLVLLRLVRARPEDAAARRRFERLLPPGEGTAG